MGAVHKYDLTSDVTHLVVGHIDTQKYKYVAKERPDVKAVLPAWIAAVRESWLQGGETDVEKLEEEYRVPTFHGLRICITGFEDLQQRKYLEETVTAHGATYQGDLTRAITHLIAAAPSGKKFDFARQWSLKTVSLEWLTDSVERRMTLDEALYDPFLPKEMRGKGAFKKLPAETTPLGKRLRTPAAEEVEGKRKLRRTASTKLGSQSSAIWNDITSGSFGVRQQEEDNLWQDLANNGAGCNEVVPAMSKADDHGSASRDQPDGAHDQPLFKRNAGCFDGRIIYVYGFDRTKTGILQEHLHQNGARLAVTPEQLCSHEDSELESGFLITPSNIACGELEDLPIVAEGLTRVNEWWVEKCLYQKKIVDPAEEVICKPFPRLPMQESRPALPLYESGSEDETGGAGAAGAAVPDDPAPPYPDDDTTSQPKHLQELSQSDANALRKPLPTDASPADQQKQPQHPDNLANAPPAAAAPPQADNRSNTDLNNTIAALLAQKKQKEFVRPASAGSDNAAAGMVRTNRQQRRHQLGRAPSVTSNGSAPSSLSAQNSFSAAAKAPTVAEDEETAAAPPWTNEAPVASQTLAWGDCGDEAERVEVIRRLGGKVAEAGDVGGDTDGMKAVERIGRVADAGDGGGARAMRTRATGSRTY
ncbi:protein kinase activating protein dpb11 [Diplodia seriata]|uniref:Protein kinase activating protein dpb11 n=1 Tax=Diplodia seriata TaxID=420778 RepID=A0ABR3CRK3_9PEZI